MTDDSAVYAFTMRISACFDRAVSSFLKIPRQLAAAEASLSPDQFEALLGGLPFPRNTARIYLDLSDDPDFQSKHPTPAAITKLLSAAPALLDGASPAPRVATEGQASAGAAVSPPARVATEPAGEGGGVRMTRSRLLALTGLLPDELRDLAVMTDPEFSRATGIGLAAWRRERSEPARRPTVLRRNGAGDLQISNFEEAAE